MLINIIYPILSMHHRKTININNVFSGYSLDMCIDIRLYIYVVVYNDI